MFQAAQLKVNFYERRLKKADQEFTTLQHKWRQQKRIIRGAHWRQAFTEVETSILNENPWEAIKNLRTAEYKFAFAELKLKYYASIVRLQGFPCVKINEMREQVQALVHAHPEILH